MEKPLETFERQKIERQVAFESTKETVKDWQGKIKRNRESRTQDFRDHKKRTLKPVDEEEHFKKNAVLSMIESKAKELNLYSEEQVKENEKKLMAHLSPK